MASPFSRREHSPRRIGRATSGSGDRNDQDRLGPSTRPQIALRNHALSVDTGTTVAAARHSRMAPFDDGESDSDTDNYRSQRKHKRANLLQSGRELLGRIGVSREDDDYDSPPAGRASIPKDNDSDDSDECVILTDDEDDGSEQAESPKRSRQDIDEMFGSVSPQSSMTQNDIVALKSMFAEKHPWRRQSRRDSNKVYSSHGPKLPVASRMDDEANEPLSIKTSIRERISGLSILPSRSEDEEEDESSSSSEDEVSSTQSSISIISDHEEDLDFAALEQIPNYFTSHPDVMFSYVDACGLSLSEEDSSMFAYEHALLLRAVLQLLAERDYIGVEADIDDPLCIVKKGPLKKATHSVGRNTWRVKYVEIRPGSFSYFEDSSKRNNFGRKTIPLRSSKCKCESVNGNLFALEVNGGPRRVWMTNSDDECQAWMRAVQAAMIGGGVGETMRSPDSSQYQAALDQFQQAQSKLLRAASRNDYKAGIEELLQTNVRVPAQWVSDRVNVESRTESRRDSITSPQKPSSVTGFLNRLKQEDAFSINGCVVSTNRPRTAERILGALSRCILELDKSSPVEGRVSMSELQALSFARDVVMCVLRSRSRDHSRACLEYLCLNPKLVAVEVMKEPETVEPLCFEANYATAEIEENPEKDISGWIATRTRSKGTWRNRFLVISDGILSVFEHSSPRPHGLRGQILLSDADVSVVKDLPKNEAHLHILRIVSKNREAERHLLFPDEALPEEWKNAVAKTMDFVSSSSSDDEGEPTTLVTPRASIINAAGGRIIQGASESGVKMIRGATDQFIKATDMIRSSMRSSSKSGGGPHHSRSSSLDMRFSTSKHGGGSKHGDRGDVGGDTYALNASFDSEFIPKQEPTVQITAECTSTYRIVACSSSPRESTVANDTLVTARVKFLHTFLLCGGSHGRLTTGDELVEIEFRRSASLPSENKAFCPSESASP